MSETSASTAIVSTGDNEPGRFYGPYMSTDLLSRDGYLVSVQACQECGALVADADHAKHDAWHEAQS